jgi:Amt family ammonium transporter
VDSGDTAWLLVCAGLVLFMTPGLALFYGGMVRAKNVLAMLVLNTACIAVVSTAWTLIGWSLAFGPDAGHGLIGGLRLALLGHPREAVAGLALHVPPLAFFAYQMMFAVITTALLTGSGADRIRLSGFALFAGVWSVLVYAPLAHWVFAPSGWLAQRGLLDFAGGTVVELNSGAAGLALALVLGRRHGWPKEAMAPHSLPLSYVGAGILWFGWFGFNAGSALAADGLASQALVNTHLAACGGLLGWLVVERLQAGRATTLGAMSGAVAGLVAITPAAGFVSGVPALLIGAAAGACCLLAVELKFRLGYDDSLDVVGVHGVGGLVGTLAIGLLADRAVNGAVQHQGLLLGGGLHQLGTQALGVLVTLVFSFVGTLLIAKACSRVIPLRASVDEEREGLDTAVHAENAYDLGAVRTMGRM